MTLRIFAKTLRIYSIAVASEQRGQKLGSLMLAHAFNRAKKLGKQRLSLEADAADPRLVNWYHNAGFRTEATLPHYYGRNRHGVRMSLDCGKRPSQ